MNEKTSDDPKLGALLRQARICPGLPPRFQQDVWRRIEAESSPAKVVSWLDAVAMLALRPRFALTAAALLLLAGALAGTVEGRHMASHDSEMAYLASEAPQAVR